MGKNLNSSSKHERLLISKSGHENYQNPDCVEKLLRYITRENGQSKEDLVCSGALGATDFTDITSTIQQFEFIQDYYKHHESFGRYMDHEIFTFTPEDEHILNNLPDFTATLARKLASDFYADGYQVYYGIHKKNCNEPKMHIHFAINTVNFRTYKKRHSYHSATKEREKRLNQIMNDSLQEYLSNSWNN